MRFKKKTNKKKTKKTNKQTKKQVSQRGFKEAQVLAVVNKGQNETEEKTYFH